MRKANETAGTNRVLTAVAMAALWLRAPLAHALINPRFTPIQLVKQAGVILWVDLKAGESKDLYTATILEMLRRASCAYIYPDMINGNPARCQDSLANDQDWALVFLLLAARNDPELWR